ncbi:MAG: VTT domain-containing protein [Candidatus Taylorbacteria bacterium]|nr:VTT domain-containing protein [Candidatus Taylorbacteria bacterium]
MQELLISFSTNHTYLIYALIIILACAEGPVLSMILGVLIKLNYFVLLPIYISLMIGDLLGDIIWYYIGYHFGHRFIGRFGKYFSITEDNVTKVTNIFHKYKYRILFISKISNGFSIALAILVTAGMMRVPFLKYFGTNLVGQFIWTGMLLGIGYFFGDLYMTVDTWLGRISVVALFVVALVAALGYKKYLKTKAETIAL